jgi:SAM-dependent methyltransferase
MPPTIQTFPIADALQASDEVATLMPDDSARKESERAFHNARYMTSESDNRTSLDKWYSAVSAGARLQMKTVKRAAEGARVLEYGCADGRLSLLEERVPEGASRYFGIDISDQAIGHARSTAASLGLGNCQFEAMDAENMTFPDNGFDVVFGRGIIHHLDLQRSFSEIQRVLRPGGIAVFYEPMGHNPAINGFRKRTPEMRTPDEHPLLVQDFELARRYFRKVDTTYFGLTTLGAAALSGTRFAGPLMQACELLDRVLLRLPLLDRNAWFVLLALTK